MRELFHVVTQVKHMRQVLVPVDALRQNLIIYKDKSEYSSKAAQKTLKKNRKLNIFKPCSSHHVLLCL